MTIRIFWRLVLSHLGILFLSGAACLYSIIQLGSVSHSARNALVISQQVTANKDALIDTFLSQVRYGGKYLITHTEGRHDQLLQFKKDFVDYLDRLRRLEESDPIAASLSRIERLHAQYHSLFDREAAYIRANQSYAQTRYQQERDKIVANTLEEFDVLKEQLRASQQERLESIDRGSRAARRIAVLTTVIVLIFGALFSLRVSKNLEASVNQASAAEPVSTAQWLRTWRVTAVHQAAKFSRRTLAEIARLWVFARRIGQARNHRFSNPKTTAPGNNR